MPAAIERTTTRTTTRTKTVADLFTRREAAVLAEVSLKAVDKAIEEQVVEVRRLKKAGAFLGIDDVLALAVIGKAGLPLQSETKKRIRRWIQEAEPSGSGKKAELALSEVLVIRLDPTFRVLVRQLKRYQKDRARFIDANPSIKRGEPVITGTRLPVRAVAERVKDGDTIEDLVEDYPSISRKAFEAALLYAHSHPRRGRPARPWRDA
jgi:uncharacterized protein (DUF433 family)